MEQQPQSSSPLFQLNVDANTGYTLKSAASWGRLLGILGIIFGVLFIVAGIMVQQTLTRTASYQDFGGYGSRSASMIGNAGMIAYIIMGVITLVGSIFALNFGNKAAAAIRTNDQNSLRASFAAVRNYFAFWSILMIIGLLFCIIALVQGGFTASM
jgi:hypothetical protein